MTTAIFSGGTPRAIDSWRSGSWTVISSSAADADALVAAAREMGEIDVLVNCAGFGGGHEMLEQGAVVEREVGRGDHGDGDGSGLGGVGRGTELLVGEIERHVADGGSVCGVERAELGVDHDVDASGPGGHPGDAERCSRVIGR